MQVKDIKQKTKQELERMLREGREKLRTLRFDVQLKQFKNVREIRKAKKAIAQIATVLRNTKDYSSTQIEMSRRVPSKSE